LSTTRLTAALDALRLHHDAGAPVDMRAAFANDAGRFERFSLALGDLLLDYSKCAVNTDTVRLLCDLAREAGLEDQRNAMFAGEPINTSEGRAVLHVALRKPADEPMMVDGRNVMPDVEQVLARMEAFARREGPSPTS
jgi:glucose-6-phosphate isomerase